MRVTLRESIGAAVVALACGPIAPGQTPRGDTSGPPGDAARLDDAWLYAIGVGEAQTARVCARGSKDRVATAFCADQPPAVTSLTDLYAALGLDRPPRGVASTTHSLGLSARFVTAANPRTFVYSPDEGPVDLASVAAVGFARGEQLVELVGLDPSTLDYRFYVLRFEQACNATRCTPADLLTESIEHDWTGFTLYEDRDLEDTPLDCLSCHRPFGPGTWKQLLMRQTASPWLHWGDFRGVYEHRICQSPTSTYPGAWIPGDGLDLLVALEGRAGHHAGIPVTELQAAASGERFALFLTAPENELRARRVPNDYAYAQLEFGSTEVLCERLEGKSDTFERLRRESLGRGQPVPYFANDVLDPAVRRELTADRAGYFARHESERPLEVAQRFMADDASRAVGLAPRESDGGEELVRAFCARCHARDTEPHLKRSHFNVDRLERVEPELARKVAARMKRPRSSPELMPPLRAAELPAWAVERILAFIRGRCSDPRPGACD